MVRFQIPTTPNATLQSNFNRQLLAVSPDGTQVAMTADRLYLRRSPTMRRAGAGDRTLHVADPSHVFAGRQVDRLLDGIRSHSEEDRPGHRHHLDDLPVAKAAMGWCGAATPSYFADTDKGIRQVSENGGQPELIIPIDGRDQAYGPQMLPDGETLLFAMGTRNMPSWDTATIVAAIAAYQSAHGRARERETTPYYVKTGHLLFSRGGVL